MNDMYRETHQKRFNRIPASKQDIPSQQTHMAPFPGCHTADHDACSPKGESRQGGSSMLPEQLMERAQSAERGDSSELARARQPQSHGKG
jgi:hypothetical protein